MLSYQHGFHAGNRADVLKHAVLDSLLRAVAEEPRPVLYIETHAGRGVYDLTGPQAAKGGEAERGIIPLMTRNAPDPLVAWLDLVRARGREAYPGSPALAQARLDGLSRLILFERHPQEYTALCNAMGTDTRIQIRYSDGYAGALTLSPRAGEQVIVFVDPSYETRRDIEALALWTPRALKRWPRGLIILWLPHFRDEREADIIDYLPTLGDAVTASARWPVAAEEKGSLTGSAMIAFGATKEMRGEAVRIGKDLQAFWNQR